MQMERGMGVAMVADLVAGRGGVARDGGEAMHIHPADEKRCGYLIAVENIEQLICPFTRTIVKRKSNGPAPARASIDRWRKQSRRPAADRVRHQRACRTGRAHQGYPTHVLNCNTPEQGRVSHSLAPSRASPLSWFPSRVPRCTTSLRVLAAPRRFF